VKIPNRDLRYNVAAMQKKRNDNVEDRTLLQQQEQTMLATRAELDAAIAKIQRDIRICDHAISDLDSDIKQGVTKLMLNESHDMELWSRYATTD